MADGRGAADLATRLADYLATRNTPWPDESVMREAVAETVRLICTEARDDALEAMGMDRRYTKHLGEQVVVWVEP
jgi:hypothetical protein